MAILLANYNPIVFDKIPRFEKVVPKLKALNINYILDTLGQIFVKHDVYRHFGLIVVHRHFALNPQEVLVELTKPDGTCSVALPWNILGNQVSGPVDSSCLESWGLNPNPVKFILAQTWAFDNQGGLQPFEFQGEADHKKDSNIPPQPSESFCKELFAELRNLGLEKTFGLRRQSPKSWESTLEKERVNVTHFGETPDELIGQMTTISWTFNENGKVSSFDDCCGHQCCGHSGGCGCHR